MADVTFDDAKRVVAAAKVHHESAARALFVQARKGEVTQAGPHGQDLLRHDRKARALRLALEVLEACK